MTNNKKTLTVAIGIPTYREENNIRKLIHSVLVQKNVGFDIREIIVISDASPDRSIREAQKINDSRVKIFKGKVRRGKVFRLNQLFKIAKSVVLIQLDGDVILKSNDVVQKLIEPFMKNRKISIVFGNHLPLKPKTFIEKLAYFGVEVWNEGTRSLGIRGERYHVTGQIRAFAKTFYKAFRYPKGIYSSEDVYSFYFAKNSKLSVTYSPKAVVYFKLPDNIYDYVRQMKRFLKTQSKMSSYFNDNLVKTYATMSTYVKLKAFLKLSLNNSIYIAICYLLIQLYSKMAATLHKQIPLWEVSLSSKKFEK